MAELVRNYAKWSSDDLEAAVAQIKTNKMTFGKASKMFNIPKSTLFNHIAKKNKYAQGTKILGRPPVMNRKIEEELTQHVLDLADNMFGLTNVELRGLAFDVAEKNKIPHSFNKITKLAGKTWLKNFMRRVKVLALRQPENLSIARINGFTRENVDHFYNLLANLVEANGITGSRMYNMDETGFTCVPKKLPKTITKKGKRRHYGQVAKERGTNTTVVCAVSATGHYIPPMMIFKGSRVTADLCIGITEGGRVCMSPNGWIDCELFVVWLHHFIENVRPSVERKILLVLDGHTSHTANLEAIELARDNGIVLLQLPAHTTHRLQPLDVTYFGPVSKAYAARIATFQAKNAGIGIKNEYFCGLICPALEKCATTTNAINGFAGTGIWPINRQVFNDSDFAKTCGLTPPLPPEAPTGSLGTALPPLPAETTTGSLDSAEPLETSFEVCHSDIKGVFSILREPPLPAETTTGSLDRSAEPVVPLSSAVNILPPKSFLTVHPSDIKPVPLFPHVITPESSKAIELTHPVYISMLKHKRDAKIKKEADIAQRLEDRKRKRIERKEEAEAKKIQKEAEIAHRLQDRKRKQIEKAQEIEAKKIKQDGEKAAKEIEKALINEVKMKIRAEKKAEKEQKEREIKKKTEKKTAIKTRKDAQSSEKATQKVQKAKPPKKTAQ